MVWGTPLELALVHLVLDCGGSEAMTVPKSKLTWRHSFPTDWFYNTALGIGYFRLFGWGISCEDAKRYPRPTMWGGLPGIYKETPIPHVQHLFNHWVRWEYPIPSMEEK